eukprot:TRINITY_DN114312_c0_g1_i1.p1 TRINITY_DN114312_c0_g1~~TRINITY_DN114312_c0_g1_i1.p1  ORF type:complete len:287 (+),score=38.62 TRINITY_DN114312_c0_g1_i1:48-908(+)
MKGMALTSSRVILFLAIALECLRLSKAMKSKEHPSAHLPSPESSFSELPDPACPANSFHPPCSDPFDTCMPDAMPANAVILWGDSHSMVMRPAIEAAVSSLNISASEIFALSAIRWKLEHSPSVYNNMKKQLSKHLGAGHIVMFNERGDLIDDFGRELNIDTFRNQLNFLTHVTAQKGATLIVFKDNQLLPHPPSACKLQQNDCGKSKSNVIASQNAKCSAIDEIDKENDHVFVFDMLQHTCNETTCSMYEPGSSHIIFSDLHHINRCGTNVVTAPLRAFLNAKLR